MEKAKGRNQMIKTVFKWVVNVALGFLIVIVVLSLISSFQARKNPNQIPSVFGYKTMSVLTGSMRPVLQPGDMIVTKEINPQNITVDDVITYWVGDKLVTHRVIDVVNKDGKLLFETKGDNNNIEDQELVQSDKVVGKLAFNIPKAGYTANFIRSGKGLVIFFILPIMLIVAGELKKVLSEMSKEDNDKNHTDNMEV